MKAHGDDTPRDVPREIDERLADWVDGRMSPRDRERFEAELRVNAQLRRDLEHYEHTVGVLRAALRAPLPGSPRAPIADRVLAAVQAEAAQPAVRAAKPFRLSRLWWTLASAAALLVVALFVNGLDPGPLRSDVAVLEPASGKSDAGRAAADPAAAADEAARQGDVADRMQPKLESAAKSTPGFAAGAGAGDKQAPADVAKAAEEKAQQARVEAEAGEAKKVLESLQADAPIVTTVVPAPTLDNAGSWADLLRTQSAATPEPARLADGKPAEGAPAAATPVSVPAGPSTAGPAGPTTGGLAELAGSDRGSPSGAGAPGAPGSERKNALGGGGAGPGGATGASRSPAPEQEKALPAEGAKATDGKPSGGRFGSRGRGAAPAATTNVAMILVEGTQPAAPTRDSEDLDKARRATDPANKAKHGATDKAGATKADDSKDTRKADREELLDHDSLRARAAGFFALAEDAAAGAAATTFATKSGRVELQPLLDVTFELDETRALGAAAATPAAIDRTWILTGPRADVQAVLAVLADWSRQHGLVLRSGETKANPALLAEPAQGAPTSPRPTARAGGAATADAPGAVVERMQVVVRIRLRARQ